jgi:hypothetical protein
MESIVVVKRWYYITCPRTESLMHESMQTCYSEMGVNMCEHMVSTWHLSWLKINVVTLHGRQAIWKLSASYYSWRGRASWYIMKYHDIIEIYIHVCVYTHVCICMYVCMSVCVCMCIYIMIGISWIQKWNIMHATATAPWKVHEAMVDAAQDLTWRGGKRWWSKEFGWKTMVETCEN